MQLFDLFSPWSVFGVASPAESTPELAMRVRRGRERVVDTLVAGVTTENKVNQAPTNHILSS